MASIVNAAKLTVILKEEVKLNNQEYGNRNSVEINSINEVSQRIITVPSASNTSLMKMSGSVGAGTFVLGNLQYARITNLDNKNFVRLSFISQSSDNTEYNRFDIKLEAKQSYMFTNAKLSGSSGAAEPSFLAFADFTNLTANSDTASVDVEIFIASA
ncbi:MAG TPA: hypothetical protein EYG21_00700 [Nitrospinaceae bacterium]|jgi:hypothetical protein|nr:hypothetical protein [Nitrospinaceae bacterium]